MAPSCSCKSRPLESSSLYVAVPCYAFKLSIHIRNSLGTLWKFIKVRSDQDISDFSGSEFAHQQYIQGWFWFLFYVCPDPKLDCTPCHKSGWSFGNHLFWGAPQNCGTNIPVIAPCDFPLAISKALDTISDPKNRLVKSSGRNFPGEFMGIGDVFGFLSMPSKSNGSSFYRPCHGLRRVHFDQLVATGGKRADQNHAICCTTLEL